MQEIIDSIKYITYGNGKNIFIYSYIMDRKLNWKKNRKQREFIMEYHRRRADEIYEKEKWKKKFSKLIERKKI